MLIFKALDKLFVYVGFDYEFFTQFFDINSEEAEATYLSLKTALDTVSDSKKKIEINSQFKKARARFVWYLIILK